MKIGTSLKVRDRAISMIRRVYRIVLENHDTQDRELERVQEVRTLLGSQKAPRWLVSYVEGYRDCLRNSIMANNVEFLYTMDGKLVSTTKGHELDMRKHGYNHEAICNKATLNGFYWIGSHKPYFVGTKA